MPKSFSCEKCHFKCCKQSNYNSHLLTAKHKMETLETKIETCENKYVLLQCQSIDCGKMYTTRNGLWKHQKKCGFYNNKTISKSLDIYDVIDNQQILNLLQENKEFKNIILEQNSKIMIQNEKILEFASKPSQTTINNNKQQFNLNFFLNETCKDAMNIDDFINTLVITDAELEDFGKLGYVQGISNILIRGLKELGEHHRPIHNTDRKRNVLYMKYKEGWEKEVDEPLVFKNYLPTEIPKMTVRRMIYRISKKGFFGMNTWKQNNPTHSDITTKKHEEYMVLLHQLMCGHEPPDLDISKIVKVVSEKTLFITKR